ncbi:YhgE/Pip domain-containing protein [Bacillus alkalicellulosilyticus]|uniref:YhgE/Pip domain-containing protein n=1 Tax=Alkalihalobacterium alkalicellulosilyticum TaxID=1912214 RepID=UPI001FE74A4C|nr:YhgE/Pip domain-containing protein [Bacillus alkalicellulosilyticus]
MSKKKLLFLFLITTLVLPSFLAHATSNDRNINENEITDERVTGEYVRKDEVVYANLSSDGDLNEIYVVNILDVRRAGTIIDYGDYESVRNLTSLTEIKQDDDQVLIDAPEGQFYYQGNLQSQQLPWNIDVSYFLNNQAIDADALIGQNGQFKAEIKTSANDQSDPLFYENYILQISFILDGETFTDIEAPDATMANVGKNRQVTFTVMPEQDGNFFVSADVIDFEMEGIEIAAVPSSMAIDAPDIDDMTDDMNTLNDAIQQLHDGVKELETGVSSLNNGMSELRNGSSQYLAGMNDVNDGSAQLISASQKINEALATISRSFESGDSIDLSLLQALPDGLTELSSGLTETASGLNVLQQNYAQAFAALDSAMNSIPQHAISEDTIQELYVSGANPDTVDKLVQTYTAALQAKGTYNAVRDGLAAVDSTLVTIGGSVQEMGTALSSIAGELRTSLQSMDAMDSLAQLEEGLQQLSANYGDFHKGLSDYTSGISQLARSYHDIHSGIVEIADGTSELISGVGELRDGTGELADATNDLPEQMQEEIDKMISEFDKSDFDPISFVSPNNTKINNVQFVIKTDSITKPEEETTEEVEEQPKGFWEKLRDLFN